MSENQFAPEMSLYSPEGERLYLNQEERERFLSSLAEEDPEDRMFCQLLHYTGCRPTEGLELVPGRVLIEDETIVFRSLKKRKHDSKGRLKKPKFREVPVPSVLIERLDLVFDIRAKQKKDKDLDKPIWSMSRPTAYRLVKRVMSRAGVKGKQATGKGLRHGFGVAMITADRPVEVHVLADLMGHTDTSTTEIYLQVQSKEKKKMVIDAWGS